MRSISNWVLWVRHLNRLRVQARRLRRAGENVTLASLIASDKVAHQLPPPYLLVDPARIRLPWIGTASPRVSIIIAAYGKPEYTLRCLNSIAANNPASSCEVIVIEDASGDPGAQLPGEVPGLDFVVNEVNLGYLRTCNKAAQMARGEFLLLLNNDTELLPGAIDELVAVADAHPAAGLIGSRLIYPDGHLQEAGCIVWDDGSAWNYGRMGDPASPSFNYLREVDYCSAASVLVRREIWDALGGFDEHYLPAYCEDLDLALRVRAAGHRVLYAPRSMVIHFEGISHGTDTSQGLKHHQVLNQQKVAVRWSDVLAAQHYPNAQHLLKARDHARDRLTVVFVDHYLPEPDRDAGSRSVLSIMKAMLALGWVVKFWPEDQCYRPRYARVLEDLGIEVMCGSKGALFLPAWLSENTDDIDLFFVSRPTVAQGCVDIIRKAGPQPILFYGHDLHFARMSMEARVLDRQDMDEDIHRMEACERRVWQSSDVSFYPSTEEVLEVGRLSPGTPVRRLTPYALEEVKVPVQPHSGSGVLFVAGFRHPPNEDAAVMLVREILPHVLAACPEVHVTLAGSHPTEVVKALAGPQVTVTGSLSAEELAWCYAAARVCVIPLRFGAGVKFKTVETMAMGVPVVSTSVGVQGFDDRPDELLVSDDPEAMAAAIVRLIRDDAHWMRTAAVQAAYVERHFSLDALKADLAGAVAAVQAARSSAPGLRQ